MGFVERVYLPFLWPRLSRVFVGQAQILLNKCRDQRCRYGILSASINSTPQETQLESIYHAGKIQSVRLSSAPRAGFAYNPVFGVAPILLCAPLRPQRTI